MSFVFQLLAPLEPFLSGDRRWVGFGIAALPLLFMAWAFLGARWRADGIRRCPRCSHLLDPNVRFDRAAVHCCPECGTTVRSERQTLRRGGRGWMLAASSAMLLLLALPIVLWNNIHIAAARTLLPRWVERQRAQFPNGLVIAEEVDPIQVVLGWEPNHDARAWDGLFEDRMPDGSLRFSGGGCGNGPTPPHRYSAQSHRLRVWATWDAQVAEVNPQFEFESYGPPVYGVSGLAPGVMPPIGSPGFGGDIIGTGDVFVGEDMGGDCAWHQVRLSLPEALAELRAEADDSWTPRAVQTLYVGWGDMRQDASRGDWYFAKPCREYAPISLAQAGCDVDLPEVPHSWNSVAEDWLPDAMRLRREPDRARLATLQNDVRDAFEAERASTSGLAKWVDCESPDYWGAPCPRMLKALNNALLELTVTSHAGERATWMEDAWPPELGAELRDLLFAAMTREIDSTPIAQMVAARASHK